MKPERLNIGRFYEKKVVYKVNDKFWYIPFIVKI